MAPIPIIPQGTIPVKSAGDIMRREKKKADCEAKGGIWDEATQTCALPPKTPQQTIETTKLTDVGKKLLPVGVEATGATGQFEQAQKAPVEDFKFKEGDIVTDQETGEPKGIIKNGKYFPLPREDIEAVSRKQQAISAPIQGAMTTQQRIQQERLSLLAGQIGQINPDFQSLIEAPIDWGQAATAGVVKAAPSILRNAAIGAAAGSVVPGVGTLVGGTIGAASAIWQGVASNIEGQKKGQIAASVDVLSAARTNMRQLAMLAQQDPANAGEYIQAYNAQLSQIHRAHQQIKIETQGNLNKYIEDGTDILSDFELFLDPNIGTAKIYGDKLRVALVTGIPQDFTIGDLPE